MLPFAKTIICTPLRLHLTARSLATVLSVFPSNLMSGDLEKRPIEVLRPLDVRSLFKDICIQQYCIGSVSVLVCGINH